jgi:hypothetical protein
VDELQVENKEWENRVAELLECSEFSQEKQIEMRKQIKALQSSTGQ